MVSADLEPLPSFPRSLQRFSLLRLGGQARQKRDRQYLEQVLHAVNNAVHLVVMQI